MAYRIKMKKNIKLWPIKILKYSLPLFSFGFFGQIFLMFTTIFYCRKKESNTSPYLKCRPGHWFNKIKPIGGIAMFLHFLISFITNALYYKPVFIPSNSDLLKKSNSLPDIIFIFIKIIIITIFILDKGLESEHWAIILILLLVTGAYAYFTLSYKNRQNKILLSLNNFFCLLLFSGFCILFICKIFKFLEFNGAIFLFCSCAVIIIIYIIFYRNKEMDFVSINYKNIYNSYEYSQYVVRFYSLITNKNNSRNNSNIIQNLISLIEENCIDKNCPLKKYLENLEKGLDYEYLLLQFCEKLFQYGISKFKDNNSLKTDYSIFLIVEMNDKKKALIILESIKDEIISLQVNYNIYRCQKIIEKFSSSLNKNNYLFEYKKSIQELKVDIEKISLLYSEFLSLLLESKIQKSNNFEEINKLGYEIKKLNIKVENSFNEVINVKTDNTEIIKLYSKFVEKILLDDEKREKCEKYKKLIYNNIINIKQKDYSNFNWEIFKKDSNMQYLIISTKSKYFGNIIDCSIDIYNLFGYQRIELIGNHINILIPRIFCHKHNILINKRFEENNLKFLEGLYKNEIYSPDIIEKDVFCVSKSKFLVPINIKIYFVNTEENEKVFVVEIAKKNLFQFDLLKRINDDTSRYIVLTDKNFTIQSFTHNCINYLNLNYEHINSNYNILNFIKQFKQDYLSEVNNSIINKISRLSSTGISNKEGYKQFIKINNSNNKNNNKISYNKRKSIRKDIFNKKYLKKCKITFIQPSLKNLNSIIYEQKNFQKKSSISYNNSNIFNRDNKLTNKFEIDLYMETKSIVLDNELIGYYFYFSRIHNKENKCYLDYIIVEKKEDERDIELKKMKKYQCIFKSQFTSDDFKKKVYFYKNKKKGINNNENEDFINRNIKRKKTLQKTDSIVNLGKEEKIQNTIKFDKNKRRASKYSSNSEIPEIYNDIIINEDFIPNSKINFTFNLSNFTYDLSEDIGNDKKLIENLKNQSTYKIKDYKKIKLLDYKKQISSEIFGSSNVSKSSLQSEEDSTSKSNSNTFIDSKISNKKNLNNKKNSLNLEDNSKKKEFSSLKEKKGKFYNNNQEENKKIEEDLIFNYYKIKLNKIKFLIFNFEKERIIEENKTKNISKIEEIIINTKKSYSFYKGDDENYPTISCLNNNEREIIKEKNLENSDRRDIKARISKDINKDKILEKKIIDAINNYNEEIPIKKFRKLIGYSFFILILFGVITFYYCLNSNSTIHGLHNLFHNSLLIKYYNHISIYYIRELTLLNFNVQIQGGAYKKFPSKTLKGYISIIRTKLSEIFKENQLLMKKIFSSSINFSKNTTKFFSEITLKIRFLSSNGSIEYNSYNIFTTLAQYNSDFYNLAFTSLPLEQNHTDVFNYISNSFNSYRSGLNLLINLYNNELQNNGKFLKITFIIILITILITLIILYILGIVFFISSNSRRISYIEIFYSIPNDILTYSMINCINFINEFKFSQIINSEKEEDIDYSLEDKESQVNNKNINNKLNNTMSNNHEINNKRICSTYNTLFFVFYGIFILFIYSYFIYICIYIFSIFKKITSISEFYYHFFKYQFELFDMYNVYREYLFDNGSIISNITPYEYLNIIENEVFEDITDNNILTNKFIFPILESNIEITKLLDQNYCSLCITDYFNSIEECENKFGDILSLDFHNFMSYFIEQIRIKKNIAKFILESQNYIGNLTLYNVTKWINIFKENQNKNITFRLNLFNNEILHSDLNILFFNIVLQALENNRKILMNFVFIKEKNSYFILLIILYILFLSIIFFAFIIPMITFFDKQIYNSKNILSIIPLNILIYHSNIRSIINN